METEPRNNSTSTSNVSHKNSVNVTEKFKNLRQTLLVSHTVPPTPSTSHSSFSSPPRSLGSSSRSVSLGSSLNADHSATLSGYSSVSGSRSSISTMDDSSNIISASSSSSSGKHTTNKAPRRKSTAFIDHVTKDDIDKISVALSEMLFACNIPFAVVNSSAFKKFISVIRPAYEKHIPDRRKVATVYLDRVYEKYQDENKTKIRHESVLVIDGWKNSSKNSKNVVCMLHNPSDGSAFLNSWDFSEISENTQELVKVVDEAKVMALNMYNTRIYAVVSDNAANMVSMGRTVDEWHSTCSSHTGNLLAKDFIDSDIDSKVISLVKIFQRPEFEQKLLALKGTKLTLPANTRWCSHRDSYQSFLKNLTQLRIIVADSSASEKLTRDQKLDLADDDFIQNVRNYVACMDPICKIVNESQKFTTNIADACELWLDFAESSDKMEEMAVFRIRIEKRKNMALNIYALTANYLHPRYRDKWNDMNDSRQQYASRITNFLLQNLDNSGLQSLRAYRKNEGFFKTLNLKSIKDPMTYWELASDENKKISDLAQKLLNIPASSAQLERIFSQWSYVHSPVRNRLSSESSKKLIYIYYTLKLKDKNRSDEY